MGLRIRARAANTGACLKMSGGESDSVVVFVTVTVPSDKDEEFNKVMAADVAGSPVDTADAPSARSNVRYDTYVHKTARLCASAPMAKADTSATTARMIHRPGLIR